MFRQLLMVTIDVVKLDYTSISPITKSKSMMPVNMTNFCHNSWCLPYIRSLTVQNSAQMYRAY